MKGPLVSVIIPVFNAEETLAKALESWCGQTLREIEVICVDDCSADRSCGILNEAAERDTRIKVLHHTSNLFAGVARNTGIAAAAGRYLFFADADDWADSTLLEKAVREAERRQADLVLLQADQYDAVTGERVGHLPLAPVTAFLPDPFSFKDCPRDIFTVVTTNPWNKLFRREFVMEQQLKFQNLHNTNDLSFSLLALACASKIGRLKHYTGYHYRCRRPGSLQQTKSAAPLGVLQALDCVREELEKRGLGDPLRPALTKFIFATALDFDLLENPPAGEGFQLYYEKLRNDFLPSFGLTDPAPAETPRQKFILENILRCPDAQDFRSAVAALPPLPSSCRGKCVYYFREYGFFQLVRQIVRKIGCAVLP